MKRYVFRSKAKALAAAAIDSAGAVFVCPFLRRASLPADGVRSFLLMRLDHIGDVLQITGFPKLLKENFSRATVTVAVSSQAAPLFDQNPFVDEVLIYDAPWFAAGRFVPKPGSHTFASLVASLKARKIDTAFSLRGDLREHFLLWRAGVKERIGYGITGGGFFLTREARYRFDVHETQRSLDLIRILGVKVDSAQPRLYFQQPERVLFEAKLDAWGIAGKLMVLFQVAAGSLSKDWPAESAERFMDSFSARFPSVALVVVGNDQRALRLPPGVLDLRGKMSLRELALLSERSRLFIGPDSGPAHLASALGTPAVFLYSGTNEFSRWKPLAENAVVLKNKVVCEPCALRVCVVAGHPCMSGIRVEDVLGAAGRVLERS
jgi:heptosyltransferase-3